MLVKKFLGASKNDFVKLFFFAPWLTNFHKVVMKM